MTRQIASLDELADSYQVLFCDIWGVIHDGVAAFAESCTALERARECGAIVILLTNSPRPASGVAAQLRRVGVPDAAWDGIVSSGEVTRCMIGKGRRVFHLGPERDLALYNGLDVVVADETEAEMIVCTGLLDDETETPATYTPLLERLRARDMPFICANPDITVKRGERTVWCAGALARAYAEFGGMVEYVGKPYAEIYRHAVGQVQHFLGHAPRPEKMLAIGDGMETDIKGAMDFGIDALFIANGVHAEDIGANDEIDPARLLGFLDRYDAKPVACAVRLL